MPASSSCALDFIRLCSLKNSLQGSIFDSCLFPFLRKETFVQSKARRLSCLRAALRSSLIIFSWLNTRWTGAFENGRDEKVATNLVKLGITVSRELHFCHWTPLSSTSYLFSNWSSVHSAAVLSLLRSCQQHLSDMATFYTRVTKTIEKVHKQKRV